MSRFFKFVRNCTFGIAVAFSMAVFQPAFAVSVPLDTVDAVAQIAEINTAVAAVGIALVAAAAIAVGFKWLKAAIFS